MEHSGTKDTTVATQVPTRVSPLGVKKSMTGPHLNLSVKSNVYRCLSSNGTRSTFHLRFRPWRLGLRPFQPLYLENETSERYETTTNRFAATIYIQKTMFQEFGHRPCVDQCPLGRPTERGIAEPGGPASTSRTKRRIRREKRAARRTNHDGVFRRGKRRRIKTVTVGKWSHRHVTSGSTHASQQKIKALRRKRAISAFHLQPHLNKRSKRGGGNPRLFDDRFQLVFGGFRLDRGKEE